MRHFLRREDGSAAVEFSLLALPFFTLLIGMVEVAMFYTTGIVLEGASADAARLIRTGQVQLSAEPEKMFEDELCAHASAFLKCSEIQYQVIHVDSDTFQGAADYKPTFDDEGNLEPPPFATGNSNDVVLVTAIYYYKFMVPFIADIMQGSNGNGKVLHMTTVVIKAEPYTFGED